MKFILRSILTIFITILLMFFGIVISLKGILKDTTSNIIKQELSSNVIEVIESATNEELSQEVKTKVEDTIKNSKEITNAVDTSWDKIITILSDENAKINIDLDTELNNLIDNGEKILNEHGITISESDKQELLETVKSEEITNVVNDMAKEIRNDMNSETKMVLDIYNFLTSSTLKIIIISLIIVSLLLIALLKKSYYSWLSNFAIATLISGIVISIIFNYILKNLLTIIETESKITINTSSLTSYGYTLITIGIITTIIYIIISKIFKKPQIKKPN